MGGGGGWDEGRGAEGVPVMRAREKLRRTRPGKWFGKAMGRASKALAGDGLVRDKSSAFKSVIAWRRGANEEHFLTLPSNTARDILHT